MGTTQFKLTYPRGLVTRTYLHRCAYSLFKYRYYEVSEMGMRFTQIKVN